MILDSHHAPTVHPPYGYHNQQPVSGWPMTHHLTMTTPFETNSEYGYAFSSYENYPGTCASPEKPSHGYASPHGYGNNPQAHVSTEKYSTTHGYNLHSPTPSTYQVHGKLHGQNGGHKNQHGGHQGYGGNLNQHGGHQGFNGHQNQHGGHQGFNGHQNQHGGHQGFNGHKNQHGGHQGYNGHQAYGHTGSWHSEDYKINEYAQEDNGTAYYAMKGIVD